MIGDSRSVVDAPHPRPARAADLPMPTIVGARDERPAPESR